LHCAVPKWRLTWWRLGAGGASNYLSCGRLTFNYPQNFPRGYCPPCAKPLVICWPLVSRYKSVELFNCQVEPSQSPPNMLSFPLLCRFALLCRYGTQFHCIVGLHYIVGTVLKPLVRRSAIVPFVLPIFRLTILLNR